MKKLLSILFATLFVSTTFAKTNNNIIFNGNYVKLDNEIKIVNGRSFVPLRELGEKILNVTVDWDSLTKSATLYNDNMSICVIVPINMSTIYVNDTAVAIDAPAFVSNGTTYIPARAVAEGFGYEVGYKNSNITIDKSNPYKVGELPQLNSPKKGDTIAIINTSMGTIKIKLFSKYAPLAVENFALLAKEGYYNNLTFHRVINNFVIQGGDPTGTGTGGKSIWGVDFGNETTPNLRNFRGALCMANAGNSNSNSSQFYIVQAKDASDMLNQIRQYYNTPINSDSSTTYSDIFPEEVMSAYEKIGGCPSLDYGYTVFGQVYEGLDIIDKIAQVKTNSNDKPLTDVIINSIDISEY